MKAQLLLVLPLLLLLTSCGGGGSGATVSPRISNQQYSTATLKLISHGTLSQGSSIWGIDTTISIPVGISLKTDSSGKPAIGVAAASGVAINNSFIETSYLPSTASSPGSLRIIVLNSVGITVGEFATVTADIATGAFPKSTDFSVSAFKATDGQGVDLATVTGALITDFK